MLLDRQLRENGVVCNDSNIGRHCMRTTTTRTSVPVAPGWPQVSALSGELMGDGTPALTEAGAPPAPPPRSLASVRRDPYAASVSAVLADVLKMMRAYF